MRIVLPERIPLYMGIVFAGMMMVLQFMEGTGPAFVLLHAAFVVLWVMAFNISGGFTRASGSYVFFYGLLTIIFGTILKAVYGEAADANSVAPVLSMSVFTVSMAALLFVAVASRRLIRDVPSIAILLGARNINYVDASIGCTCMGLLILAMRNVFSNAPGTITSALIQLDIFFPLAVILGTIAAAQSGNMRRSISVVSIIPMTIAFLFGVAGFSKQGMLTPFICWIIGIAYTGFRLRFVHLIACGVFLTFTFYVLYPLAQLGRVEIDQYLPMTAKLEQAAVFVSHLGAERERMNEDVTSTRETTAQYFDHDVGFLARFTRWPSDDPLIAYSAEGHYIGYSVATDGFMNWFPTFMLPNKERERSPYNGNYYAHELGGLSPDDTTTGISFAPATEAFHMDGWIGVLVLLPAVWLLLFVSVDLLCGDLRETPWGLFIAVAFSHVAPESLLGGLIYFIWHGNLALFLGIFFSVNVAPVFGIVLTGASRRSRSISTISTLVSSGANAVAG